MKEAYNFSVFFSIVHTNKTHIYILFQLENKKKKKKKKRKKKKLRTT
jgi:hypothetical protein